MAASIVVGTPVTATGSSSSPSITYTPTASGNRLIIVLAFANGRTISTTPTAVTLYATQPTSTYGQLSWMATTGTSSITLTWAISGSSAWRVTVYEVSGCDSNGANDVISVNSHNGGGTTSYTTTGTATAAGQLPIAFNTTTTATVTVSSNNFTQDRADTTGVVIVASHSALTTNGQIVSQTIGWSASTFNSFNALILANPASSTTASSAGQTNVVLSTGDNQKPSESGTTTTTLSAKWTQKSYLGSQVTVGVSGSGTQSKIVGSQGQASISTAGTYAEKPFTAARTLLNPAGRGSSTPGSGSVASLALAGHGSELSIEFNRALLTLATAGSQVSFTRTTTILVPSGTAHQTLRLSGSTALSLLMSGTENAITSKGAQGNALLTASATGAQIPSAGGSTLLSFTYQAQSVTATTPIWRSRVESINSKIQRVMGKGARYIGSMFDVYRLNANGPSNGSILAAKNKIYSRVRFLMTVDTIGWTVEQTRIYDMVYTGMGNANLLQVGDILVDVEKGGDGAMFAVAQLHPIKPNIFCRVEQAGALSRPTGKQVNGNTSQPAQGRIGYQGMGKSGEQVCILAGGMYEFVASGVPATIPVGLQPYKRLGQQPEFKRPSGTHRNEVFCYLPLLPGIKVEPDDVISAQNGDRYLIHTVTPFTTNMQGYLVIAESLFI